MRARRSRRRERGAAAVEFALIAPVLLLMILGMLDFALLFDAQAVVANASRDAARAASLGKKYAGTTSIVTKETGSLNNATSTAWTVCAAPTIESVSWTCSGSASGDTTSYDAARTVGGIVRVNVTYTYTWITPLPNWVGLGATTSVSQASYMRVETTT